MNSTCISQIRAEGYISSQFEHEDYWDLLVDEGKHFWGSDRAPDCSLMQNKVIGMSCTHAQDKKWHFQSERTGSAGEIEYKNEMETTAPGNWGELQRWIAAHKALTHHGMQIAQRQKSQELQTEVSLEEKLDLVNPQ